MSNNCCKIGEAIETIQQYSYQYNLKILGVHLKPGKTAQETIKISETDIDITHRVQSRKKNNFPEPIVCQFTRRIVKDVLKQRQSLSNVDIAKLGLTQSKDGKDHLIIIVEH